jgi:hypothetical protein
MAPLLMEEVVVVFATSPSFTELVENVRRELNWMDENDEVELIGRYNIGFSHHTRWKAMHVNSELHWQAYKEVVLASQDKSLELFVKNKVGGRLQINLNRRASPCDASTPI